MSGTACTVVQDDTIGSVILDQQSGHDDIETLRSVTAANL
jgi:hypothetical protein